ncbi:KGG domain-containing protein [Acidiferrobacter sp.]|jgi:general stress protein YciG|uniref:KGG domain-containing protein n=1 Tax=Acidiferrobacter sp. TaxID=1872107 RepID=UPI002631B915|nr:KGG domain-containing protein [Acidiferrobacter sp.]
MPNERKKRRGFAAMDANKQREIASKGGKAAHEKGTAHEFTTEEAREAGRKGGEAVSQNREHMAAIGRKGGESSHGGWESRPRQSQEIYSERHKGESQVKRGEGEETETAATHGEGSKGNKSS